MRFSQDLCFFLHVFYDMGFVLWLVLGFFKSGLLHLLEFSLIYI